ncbi:hypothetical protein GCM10023320_49280 [Pseudonocardia adelaidensis]|uniref:SH3 domain-containing protein n=2 Tax=Pseudonocardia adelaidensis TaxID=648754 RepID=A0ABP9NPW9_9PSEU
MKTVNHGPARIVSKSKCHYYAHLEVAAMNEYTAPDDQTVPSAHHDTEGGGTRTRRLLTILALTVVGLTGAVSTAPASMAQAASVGSAVAPARPIEGDPGPESDDEPCGGNRTVSGFEGVQICPDWSPDGRIPVYEKPRADSKRIGFINAAGDDFYICQLKGGTHELRGFENNWWAFTKADGDAGFGYVPQTYFKGGGPNVKDATLDSCRS